VLLVHLIVPEKLIPNARAVDAERIDDHAGLVSLDREAVHPDGPLAERANLKTVGTVGHAKRGVSG